ncbi:unnamed protein product [Scytosiphon promiscuus]
MGSAASVQDQHAANGASQVEGERLPDLECTLKGLPGAIEEAIYVREKWPVVVDPEGQAVRYLRYQRGALLLGDNSADVEKENLRARLVSSLMHGGNFCMVFETLIGVNFKDLFDEDHFPEGILDRRRVFLEETWGKILRPDKGDPTSDLFVPRDDFTFMVVTGKGEKLPNEALVWMTCIRVRGAEEQQAADDKDAQVDQDLAGLFGAEEIKRNSVAMVEAAFDGELDEVKNWLDKGFHIESADGRGHTSISEAAAQGHESVICLLLAEGANPNALNDNGRSPLWRSCYNGHVAAVRLLLEAGADPSFRDKVSHEGPFDVAKNDETRQVLDAWDPEVTIRLCEERKKRMRARAEERLTTAAERDHLARTIIRDELIGKAVSGDASGLKQQLFDLADDADRTGQRPRATCEVRDARGMTLLSLATQHGRLEVVELLLTQWKACDDSGGTHSTFGLTPKVQSWQCRVLKANPNSRDLKGWNPAAIAVFHDSKAALELLLRHGANPYLKSSYNKSAWDLAQDELDAAGRVAKSKEEIRGVIDAWMLETGQEEHPQPPCSPSIDADGTPTGMPKDGTATMLAVEVAKGGNPGEKAGAKSKSVAAKKIARNKKRKC